jgi:hypothetical protein
LHSLHTIHASRRRAYSNSVLIQAGTCVCAVTRLATSTLSSPSQGDITIRLFPDECPRTVENFTTHATNGYYDNVIFHRVIKGFMLQTGDPLGELSISSCYSKLQYLLLGECLIE